MAFSILTVLASILYLSTSVVNASPVGPGPSNPGPPVPISPDANGGDTRVSFMNDNSLIAGYAATASSANGSETVLRVARSTDGAKSWQPLGEVFRGLTAEFDINNPFPMQLLSGRVLYAYRNHDRTGADLHYTWFRISISYSDDGGKTWLYLSTVAQRAPQGVNGLWEPFLRIALDGSIQCYYSSEVAANIQVVLMNVSKDGGQTWGPPITVAGGGGIVSRDGMVGVAPIDNNGNLIAVFENTESPSGFTVDSVLSSDDGLSWHSRSRLYTPSKGSAGAPSIVNVWGILVVGFMTNESHDVGTGYDGGDMKVITSGDGAKDWTDSFIVGPSPAHWPGVFNLSPNEFLALYSQSGGPISQAWSV